MCLFKKKAIVDGIRFKRKVIKKDQYVICFQCSIPGKFAGEICPIRVKERCDRLIILHGGLTLKNNLAYTVC